MIKTIHHTVKVSKEEEEAEVPCQEHDGTTFNSGHRPWAPQCTMSQTDINHAKSQAVRSATN